MRARLFRFSVSKSKSNITFSDGVFDEIGGFIQVQFLHDARAMIIHSRDADEEKSRNLFARFSLGNQLQDLPLAGGQWVNFKNSFSIPSADLYQIIDDLLREVRGDVRFALLNLLDRRKELFICIFLKQVTFCARQRGLSKDIPYLYASSKSIP